ncbi:DNA-protecting protein DprA [Candidatus Dojkabacteria bacterium]|nr:DNA-protecting protein DprA [Candidatus Dojkabacteria bacterium]
MKTKEKLSRFCLSMIDGVGPSTFHKLVSQFRSTLAIWDNPSELGIPKELSKKIEKQKLNFNVEKQLKKLEAKDIGFIAFGEEDYPSYLSQTKNPPPCLYYAGNYQAELFKKSISIVGTRQISDYGRAVAKRFVVELVKNGFTIISGMAFGVDSAAHRYTIDCKGRTIGVLASSVDEPTPKRNRGLYNQIINNNGLIISETFPGTEIGPWSFPQRNRIIAGTSLGTLVIEAGEDSGALITADIAFSENREIFAVPGDINRGLSKGTNKLIKYTKAKLVEEPKDIIVEFENMLEESPFEKTENKKIFERKDPLENEILRLLTEDSLTVEEIGNTLMKTSSKISTHLSLLEVEEIIQKGMDGKFRLL